MKNQPIVSVEIEAMKAEILESLSQPNAMEKSYGENKAVFRQDALVTFIMPLLFKL